jgi:integrase
MAYLRKHRGKWQSVVRIKGHPNIARSFTQRSDAKRWAIETELKIRREDAGIARTKYPTFREVALRYLNETSMGKKCFKVERVIINILLHESFAEYPINKVTPSVIARFRDKQKKIVKENTINRRLDVISTIFTTVRKEWDYALSNPVLSIRRPKNPEPRNRRFTDAELNLLLRGNRTSELMRTIVELALETGMRQTELLSICSEHIRENTLFIPVAKTKPRTIPLTSRAQEILKHASLPFNISADRLGKQWRKLCKHYGIEDAHFHDLRKQSLTNFMLKKKLSVAETMMIAGHSDPRMLLRTYNNLKVEDVAKKLD